MTPDGLQLPAEPLDRFCVVLENQQLVYETCDDVPAERQARRGVAVLLALEPGSLEKWLV
jgi:hypothetical protein